MNFIHLSASHWPIKLRETDQCQWTFFSVIFCPRGDLCSTLLKIGWASQRVMQSKEKKKKKKQVLPQNQMNSVGTFHYTHTHRHICTHILFEVTRTSIWKFHLPKEANTTRMSSKYSTQEICLSSGTFERHMAGILTYIPFIYPFSHRLS